MNRTMELSKNKLYALLKPWLRIPILLRVEWTTELETRKNRDAFSNITSINKGLLGFFFRNFKKLVEPELALSE